MNTPDQFRVASPRFVGEQDGPPERELKGRLCLLFGGEKGVYRAYLARVAYGDATSYSVALCIRAESATDIGLSEKAGKIFASAFATREHLDIIFITETQESELLCRCRPFFSVL